MSKEQQRKDDVGVLLALVRDSVTLGQLRQFMELNDYEEYEVEQVIARLAAYSELPTFKIG